MNSRSLFEVAQDLEHKEKESRLQLLPSKKLEQALAKESCVVDMAVHMFVTLLFEYQSEAARRPLSGRQRPANRKAAQHLLDLHTNGKLDAETVGKWANDIVGANTRFRIKRGGKLNELALNFLTGNAVASLLATSRKAASQADTDYEIMRKDKEAAEEKFAEQNGSFLRLEKRYEKSYEIQSELQEEADTARSQIRGLRSAIDDEKKTTLDQRKELAKLEEKVGRLEKTLGGEKSRTSKLKGELASEKAKTDTLVKGLEIAKKKVQKSEQRTAVLEKENLGLAIDDAELETLRMKEDEHRRTYHENLDLKDRIEVLKTQNKSLREVAKKQNSRVKRLISFIADLLRFSKIFGSKKTTEAKFKPNVRAMEKATAKFAEHDPELGKKIAEAADVEIGDLKQHISKNSLIEVAKEHMGTIFSKTLAVDNVDMVHIQPAINKLYESLKENGHGKDFYQYNPKHFADFEHDKVLGLADSKDNTKVNKIRLAVQLNAKVYYLLSQLDDEPSHAKLISVRKAIVRLVTQFKLAADKLGIKSSDPFYQFAFINSELLELAPKEETVASKYQAGMFTALLGEDSDDIQVAKNIAKKLSAKFAEKKGPMKEEQRFNSKLFQTGSVDLTDSEKKLLFPLEQSASGFSRLFSKDNGMRQQHDGNKLIFAIQLSVNIEYILTELKQKDKPNDVDIKIATQQIQGIIATFKKDAAELGMKPGEAFYNRVFKVDAAELVDTVVKGMDQSDSVSNLSFFK